MSALVQAALSGEILSPEDSVTLTVAAHPLRIDSTTHSAPSGLSVSELISFAEARVERKLAPQVVVRIEGELVPPELWSRVRVKTGANVVLRATAGFDGGGDLLKSVLSLAVIALSLVLPVVIFPAGGLAAALLGAAITIGGTLLINTLFPVAPPQLSKDTRSSTQSYSLSGGQNQADPFGVIPEISGTMRVYPKLGAQWYTEFIGNEQYLRGLLVVGYGPKRIFDIKIGETPIESFDDVELEVREGYEDDDPISLYPNEVVQTDLQVELTFAGSWQERQTGLGVTELSVDYVAPSGIVRFDDQGTAQMHTVGLRVEYKLVGTTNWLLLGTDEISARSRDTIRRGMRKVVPEGQYDVRIRKTTADANDDKISDSVVWTALRGFRNSEPIEFDKPLAKIGIRIRATAQLTGVVQTLNCVVSSPVRAWNGTSWVADTVSSNPGDHFRHTLQGPANARPASDSKIDLVTIQLFADYCTSEGFRFDFIHDAERSVFDTLVMIASAGRGTVLFRDGLWSVVWDQPTSSIVQHFTPRNSRNFSGQQIKRQLPHAFRVRFVNSEQGWKQDERIVYDDGYSAANATLYEGVEFPGQTVPSNVWRHGRFHIAQARLRPEFYSLEVDLEYLVCTRGDRVRVTHDIPMFGLVSGRVVSVTDDVTLVLDEPVVMEALKNYSIRFRLADGTSVVRTVSTDDGENTTITLTGTGGVPAEGDLFMFGETGSETVVLRVSEIAPSEEFTARLTMVDDAPAISQADEGTIPVFDSQISAPTDVHSAAPVNLRIQENLTVVGSVVTSVVRFSWETLAGQYPASFEAEFRDDDGNGSWVAAGTSVAPTKFVSILGVEAGTHSFRVRAMFSDGEVSGWASLFAQSTEGLGAIPGDVEDFTVQVIDDQATLSWSPATGPVDHYIIRFAPVLTGATWGTANVLQERVDATSVQVPTLVGTYLIKAITAANIESTNATLISSNVPGLRELNVVELWQGETAWSGTRTNVEVVSDDLRLTALEGVLDWGPILDITSLYWTTQFPFDYGYLASDDIVDLGEVFTSRLSSRIVAVGDNINNVIGAWGPVGSVGLIGGTNADQWSVRIFESHTSDDPLGAPVWTDYVELAVRDITARAFRFEVRLYSLAPGITPVVTSAQVTIDMPDRVIAGDDIVSSGTMEITVDFDPPFRHFEGLAIVAQDMATGDYYEVYNKDETGFQIEFFNSAGATVVRTFDYVAKGYGRQVTP